MSDASLRWRSLPGNFDRLNTFAQYPANNPWGIPTLALYSGTPPAWLWPYGARITTQEPVPGGALHFYTDDYRFERVWSRPLDSLSAIQRAGLVLTPDFSLYRDWPLALQLFNVYRNRWCGAFWQDHGVAVIPALSWSTPVSYDFAFAGIVPGSMVAIGARGLRHPETRAWFAQGYRALIAALRPPLGLVYGRLPADLQALAPYQEYPLQWKGIWSAQRALRERP
ncbi:MAG TPA: DUF4417 domain-containing protein [Chloroflexia bacterium]|nr:DUF4417 domain-containing protein [Chloroflexia bacterium]